MEVLDVLVPLQGGFDMDVLVLRAKQKTALSSPFLWRPPSHGEAFSSNTFACLSRDDLMLLQPLSRKAPSPLALLFCC